VLEHDDGVGGDYPTGTRRVLFGEGWQETSTVGREDLTPGCAGSGPSIIEGEGETVVVPPDAQWRVDGWGNIWMEVA
jgi:N-methylhydantoinase A/oxoprolinase/acetone carboxylase beta subunit